MSKKKKYFILLNFSGAGSKLLQAQIGNSDNLFTIPAYPLKYLPFFFNKWKKEKKFLSASKIFNLIKKHHASLFDSRKIVGFNGLNQLGKNQKEHIEISKKKFKTFFLDTLKNKKITLENIIKAIHEAYQFSIIDKSNNILYHVHCTDTYRKFFHGCFSESKKLLTTRHPTYNFWRRAYADDKIDESRFDSTDYENLKNYRYITRLSDIYKQFKVLNFNFKKEAEFVRFEDLKTKNYQTLKKISKYFDIKFNFSKINNPSFNKKKWFGSKIYKGHNEKKNFIISNFNSKKDLISFTTYEIFVLEMSLLPYMNKLNYKTVSSSKNRILDYFYFFMLTLLPTKYGFKLFFSRFKLKTFFNYIQSSFREGFLANNNKDYYFNALYKYKWSYDLAYLIRFNFIRKLNFKSKNNILISLFYFITKILIYPIIQTELLVLYFFRIYLIFSIFFIFKKRIKYLSRL